MKNHKLIPLSDYEKRVAEKNHNLVYSFLHRHRYSIEEYYNVVIFGYLKGIQIYNRREDLRNEFELAFICERYMLAEITNHFKIMNTQKRNPMETIVSLDANYTDEENLYNCVGGKLLVEDEIIERELLAELLGNLSSIQQEIAKMRVDGYKNEEICLLLKIKPSTFYKELRLTKSTLESMLKAK